MENLLIINRWGNVVTTLSAPFKWDGTSNGQQLIEGVYYYLVVPYESCKNKKDNNQNGMVHLIR